MLAAAVALELGLVGGGIVAVLVTLLLTIRGPGRRAVVREGPAPGRQRRLEPERRFARERRTLPRAPIARPVMVRRADGEARTFALDVGPGGVLLAGPADLSHGEELDLVLDIGPGVGARARVVHVTPEGLKGLAFCAMEDGDRALLERYAAAAAIPRT